MDNPNFNPETDDGLARSIEALNYYLEQIEEGGMWLIPRSGTAYCIRHSDKSAIKAMQVFLDPVLDFLLRESGWKVIDNT